MIMKSVLKTIAVFLFVLFVSVESINAQKVKVTTSPQSAKIYVNGVSMGAGQLVVTPAAPRDCMAVQA